MRSIEGEEENVRLHSSIWQEVGGDLERRKQEKGKKRKTLK